MKSSRPNRIAWTVTLVILGCSMDAPTPTLDEIIERNTAAMGGRARLEQLRSVRIVRNETMLTVTRRPYFHKVELFSEDGRLRYAEGINGFVAWEQTSADTVRRPVTGRPAQALWRVLQWPGPLNPLYRLAERGHTLSQLPDTVLDGTRYHLLLLALSDGFERQYYVNSDTYQIERARDYRRRHASDEEVQNIEGVWGDFRTVDGYVFPFYSEERNYATGERFYGSTLLAVQVNVDAPDDEFSLSGSSSPDVLRAIVAQLGSSAEASTR